METNIAWIVPVSSNLQRSRHAGGARQDLGQASHTAQGLGFRLHLNSVGPHFTVRSTNGHKSMERFVAKGPGTKSFSNDSYYIPQKGSL